MFTGKMLGQQEKQETGKVFKNSTPQHSTAFWSSMQHSR